jgi:uncharacterized protein
MEPGRLTSIVFASAVLAISVGSCGSDGSDSTSTANVQNPSEHVSSSAAPYKAAQSSNVQLYRAVQADPQTVAALRNLMAAAADEIGGYWGKTVPAVYGVQYTQPRFVGGYDPANGAGVTCGGKPNALPGNAFYCVPDNYIAWDEPGLMVPLLKYGALAPVFVLAHEWGHSVQHQVAEPFKDSIHAELNADCLAGAWAQDAASRGKLDREDFDSAVEVLRKEQDAAGVPWTDSQAHGTAFERIDNFGKGVDGGPTACINPNNGA